MQQCNLKETLWYQAIKKYSNYFYSQRSLAVSIKIVRILVDGLLSQCNSLQSDIIIMTKCQLQPIHQYPFDLQQQTYFIHLNYTCFITAHTANQLQICTHAFRYLCENDNKKLIMLVVDQKLQHSEEVIIFAPLTVLKWFTQSKDISVLRQPIRLINPILPQLEPIKQVNVYFNSNFIVDPAIIHFLSSCDFICQTGQYFIDCQWFKSSLGQFKSLKSKLNWQRLINQCSQKQVNYLRIYMQVNQGEKIGLFRLGQTKLNIKQQLLHPYNIYTSISLDSLEQQIFSQLSYRQALTQLKQQYQNNQIIFIETQKDIALETCLHAYSQVQLQLNYRCIDCQFISSTKQFWNQVDSISWMDDSLIFIRNIAWIEELYQSQQILHTELKHILDKLEKTYLQILSKSIRKYCILIQHIGQNSISQAIQKSTTIPLRIDKAQKIFIFATIFSKFQEECSYKQQIMHQFHDKFGWEIFLNFMTSSWKHVRSLSKNQVFKKLRQLVKQEQVQNLIEVSWDDVGGLETAKEQIVQTVLLPIKHPEIFDQWIKPRTGLLFYGPPGTGKTLLGKCVAKQCKMNFISVKGPQLLNMYVGQSEKNVRSVFERARACSPCIIFMDELDALVPKRGNSGDSNQVMDRIVAQLLQQMDTASSNQVFIIGATNRPDLLDPSILRPGRFDKQIYLGITQARQDRVKIIKAQTRHLTLQQDLNWDRILDSIPKNFTGADFYGLTSRAVMAAAQRTIEQYEKGMIRQKISLREEDFLAAIPGIKPSVTEADLSRYETLRQIYS